VHIGAAVRTLCHDVLEVTVSRKTVRLTLDNLADLPTPCRSCLFWELDPVRRERLCEEDRAQEKEVWLSHVLREWGSCGRLAMVDDQAVGYAIYAPAAFVPGSSAFPTAPISPDAVQLTTVYVDAEHAGGGIGRLLIQGMARDLIKRGGLVAVEAFGDSRGRSGHCVVPADFLSSVGFKTQRAHPRNPRMRMELKSALTWKDEVEQAIEKLLGVVRPAVRPAPKAARPHARDGQPPALT
jgi:GNAT superfamily N-acetyltransferase